MEPWTGYGNPAGRDEEIAIVEAVLDAFGRGDLAGALPYLDPDVEMVSAGTQGRLGRTEPYRGHAGVDAYLADVARAWEELELRPGQMRVTPGGVVAFGEVVARADGRQLRRRAVWTWRLRDGLVTSIRAEDLGDA